MGRLRRSDRAARAAMRSPRNVPLAGSPTAEHWNDSRWSRCETPPGYAAPSVLVAAGGRDSSASDVIASVPRAAFSSTSVASSAERA